MPFTLAEHAKAQTDPLKKGVYLGIVRASVIADILGFSSTKALTKTGVRYDKVPTPAFIPINGSIPEQTVSGKNLSYGVYEMALHLDIPVPLEDDQGVLEKPSTRQSKMALIGASYLFNDQFVNGDQGTDPNGFEGIEKIVGNLASGQTIGSSEIDMSTGGSGSSVWHSLMDLVDNGIDAIEGHEASFGLCNRQFGQAFRGALRRASLLGNDEDWTTDGFPFGDARKTQQTASSKPLFVYQNVPFYDVGVKGDQTTQIIGNTYTEGGSTAHGTRVYLVKLDEDNVEGLQYSPPGITRIGVLEDRNVVRHRFLWDVGLGVWGARSIVKLQGVRAI